MSHLQDVVYEKALGQAAEEGDVAVAEALLAKGTPVDVLNVCSRTPLYLAAKNGHFRMVDVLLKARADVDKGNSYWGGKGTPLAAAAEMGHLEVAKLLLNAKACASSVSRDSTHPLHLAAEKNHALVCKLLLERGAEVEAVDAGRDTALHKAAYDDNEETVALLIEAKANIDALNGYGQAPLTVAAHGNRHKTVKLLLSANANVNAGERRQVVQMTPLLEAVRMNHVRMATTLIQAGADVLLHSPISVAVRDGSWYLCELLLKNKVSPDTLCTCVKEPEPLLHVAARNNWVLLMKMLLRHNASVNILNSWREPALLAAVKNNHLEATRVLLKAGAVLDSASVPSMEWEKILKRPVKRVWNWELLYHAASQASLPICKLLMANGVKADQQLFKALANRNWAMHVNRHNPVTEWIRAASSLPALSIAIDTEQPADIVIMSLRLGRVNPDDDIKHVMDTLKKARASPLHQIVERAYGLSYGASPDRRYSGWRPMNHWLHHKGVRDAISTMLLIVNRMEHTTLKMQTATSKQNAAFGRLEAAISRVGDADDQRSLKAAFEDCMETSKVAEFCTSLPVVPKEVWIGAIFAQFSRGNFPLPAAPPYTWND